MSVEFREIEGKSAGYLGLLALLGGILALGLGSALYMEHNGHWVTGMTNQIVWGVPHVFAVFLIVAATGALNVASVATVFNRHVYKYMGRLSGLLAISLLAGGLMILVLDLGHPDRLIVAMTHYNFKSIFAWNMILYNGFFAAVFVYLWAMMDRNARPLYKPAGIFAFAWRIILTTGTGSIFGFLIAREAYNSAVMGPMFVAMSFAYGTAIFVLVLLASYAWTGRPLGDLVVRRLKNMLGIFLVTVFYFVLVFHIASLYVAQRHGVEEFLLFGDNIYSTLFWVGQMLIGLVVPFALLYLPGTSGSRFWLVIASLLVVIGGVIQMYVTIIGGQAWPLDLFPGLEESSSFFDGVIHPYHPSLPEFLLGLSGMAVTLLMVALGVKILRFLPMSLEDHVVDPQHHKAAD